MKMMRLALVTILIVSTAITAGYFLFSPAPPRYPVNVDKLMGAVRTCIRDQKAKGGPLSESVSLHELLAGGYLQTNDVRAFDGIDLALNIHLFTDAETYPNTVLEEAKMPDGNFVLLLGDGSVQQMSPSASQTIATGNDSLRHPTSVPPPSAGVNPGR